MKGVSGRFFEDFALGEEIRHPTPRTVSEGDRALYLALTGSRFAVNCAQPFARALGLPDAPLDDLLVFHIVFGKSVPDTSRNAVANLGYAAGRFGVPVYPGDTLTAHSEVIGLKENSSRETGTVYVRTRGLNQRDETVLAYVRWVMVRKREPSAAAPGPSVPALPEAVAAADLAAPAGLDATSYDCAAAGSPDRWDDFAVGERIDHGPGMAIEEAEHQMATRLYQNTAGVHFDEHAAKASRFGRRLVYGGHVISLARALSFEGLGNAFRIAALNGGRHVAPTFASDTLYAWSEILDKATLPGRSDLAALRLRTIAAKDHPCSDHPGRAADGRYHPAVVLDLDYWVLIVR